MTLSPALQKLVAAQIALGTLEMGYPNQLVRVYDDGSTDGPWEHIDGVWVECVNDEMGERA